MIGIKANLTHGESIIYQVNKKKWLIPTMIFFCPFGLLIAFLFIVPCYKNMFLGEISFDSSTTYILSIFFMLLFVPIAVLSPISYLLNRFVITNQRIFIRRGVFGVLHIIDISDIIAYQHFYISSKGSASHYIHIYLKSGKRISSGDLFIKNKDIPKLLQILDSKIAYTISSRKQYKEFKKNNFANCTIDTRRNLLLPIISLSPFIISLIMLILYFNGANEMGKQIDVQIYGTVESKVIEYDDGEISGYDFEIRESNSNKVYEFPADENIYAMFDIGDNILIKAKKGLLGIVYDQWVYTE